MWQDYPRYRHKQGSDSHVGKIVELGWRHTLGADLKHGYRYGGWCQTHDHGGRNIVRQRLDDVLRNTHDIHFCSADVDSVLEKNVRDAAAVVGVTMDILDAFHRGSQESFEQIRDAPFHLLWQQSGVDPDHRGDRNRDIREDD